jgi:hypothetical protein
MGVLDRVAEDASADPDGALRDVALFLMFLAAVRDSLSEVVRDCPLEVDEMVSQVVLRLHQVPQVVHPENLVRQIPGELLRVEVVFVQAALDRQDAQRSARLAVLASELDE